MFRRIILTLLVADFFLVGYSKVPKHTADSIANLLNKREIVCDKACPLFESENSNSGLVNTIFIDVLAMIGTAWLYSNYKKKYFLAIGAVVVIGVTGSWLIRNNDTQCTEYSNSSCKIVASGSQAVKSVKDQASSNNLDEFQQMDSATSDAATSKFSKADSSATEFTTVSGDDTELTTVAEADGQEKSTMASLNITDPRILDPLIAFVLLTLIGMGIRYHQFVRLRGLFLLAGVVWFGFYRGGCACMISSFQSIVLGAAGWNVNWIDMLWMAALVVSTYLFGRFWCGWLCHLGGIQDFLFRRTKMKILTGEKSQKYLRLTRYIVFGAWIMQLLIMRKNLYCEYDPFKSLFNMIFTDWTSVALLLAVLVSSVLIYRPFCRMICPVGVILGWVSKLPGANRIRVNSQCANCGLCLKNCDMRAIRKTDQGIKVNNESCIACGECTLQCHHNGIKLDIK